MVVCDARHDACNEPWSLNARGVCLVLCLQALLDQVVIKSRGYSVDQLERLYSVLSQCIYQYRRDYDKTCLIEVSSSLYVLTPVML